MSLSEENLAKLLAKLNANIETLTIVTALTFGKDSLFKGKETKPEQIQVLEDMKLPDHIIALIIGSTLDSVRAQRSQRKAKAKKTQVTESEKKTEEVKQ